MALFGGTEQPKPYTLPTRAPNQIGAQNQLLQMGLSGIQNLPQPSFEPIAERARTQFNTQTIPGLAERFTSLGGGQRSSAFQGALGQAGAGLEEALAALGSQFGLQQRGQDQNFLSNLLGMGLSPQFENIIPQGQGGFGSTFGGAASLLPFLPMLLGGGQQGLGQQQEIAGQPGSTSGGGFGGALKALLPYIPAVLGGIFGGPGGASAGMAAGQGLQALFKR